MVDADLLPRYLCWDYLEAVIIVFFLKKLHSFYEKIQLCL